MVAQIDQETQTAGKVIYTAKVHTVGGRENGVARSLDGRLDVRLSLPGSPRAGTNPEQLFAAGWSACFESAIGIAARKRKVTLPELTIDADVDLHLRRGDVEGRINIAHARRCIGSCYQVIGGLGEGLRPQTAPVLKSKGEAAGVAQTRNRRRGHHHEYSIWNGCQLLS